MIDVINLALPVFGLIFIGFACVFGTLASVDSLIAMMWLVKTHKLPQLLFRS